MQKKLLDTSEGQSSKGGHKYKIEYWAGEVAEVQMVSYPTDAARTLAVCTKGYTGDYTNTIEPVELDGMMQDLKRTKLGTPAEMLNFVFLVRDVPRSWTHQAVRTRVGAAVVQESTRFIGAMNTYRVLVPKSMHRNGDILPEYTAGNAVAIHMYEEALEATGAASQDARNLLPHSLLTHMYWSLTLRALMGIYEVRWCCQAEPSTWIPVMKQMRSLIETNCGPDVANFLTAPIMRGQNCGFNASFDRPCEWKARV